jgi:hypothetical protein
MRAGTGIVIAALVCSILCTSPAPADIPARINYQVMLTDDADTPLANETLPVTFRLFDDPDAGTQLWDEAHSVETNGIGVATVVLGETDPLDALDFDQALWLEVVVDGQVLTPRRQFLAVPYAIQAKNASELGGTAAGEYLTEAESGASGTINAPENPLDWTMLKSVPAGFADGVDDVGGSGDGHSLDASDGDPANVVSVDASGNVSITMPTMIGTSFPTQSTTAAIKGWGGPSLQYAGQFEQHPSSPDRAALYARADTAAAILANGGTPVGSKAWCLNPTAVTGVGWGNTNGGYFSSLGWGYGVMCESNGGTALMSVTTGPGYAGHFDGGSGVYVELDEYFPGLKVTNQRSGNDSDAAHFFSGSGAQSTTWTLLSSSYEGVAGEFVKDVDDNEYAVEIWGVTTGSEGLFVQGYVTTTSPLARAVETSRGREAVFSVASPGVDVMASGTGTLTRGTARVEFERLFTESIEGADGLRVTATPVGGWSALYVESIDEAGFTLRSDSGDPDVEFHWVAVGRSRGFAGRPEVVIPDPGEHARLVARKEAAYEERKAEIPNAPRVVIEEAH